MGKSRSSYIILQVKSSVSTFFYRTVVKLISLWLVSLIVPINSLSVQVPDKYFQIRTFPFKNGFARIQVGEKFGFISKNGHRIVDAKYKLAKDFSDVVGENGRQLACVQIDQRWHFIDQKGHQAIDWQFDDADTFHCQLAAVGIGNIKSRKYGYVDVTGNMVLPPKYTKVGSFVKMELNAEQWILAPFQSGRKFGYLRYCKNKKPVISEVVPAKYTQAFPFSADGIAKIVQGKRYGYISIQKIAEAGNQKLGTTQINDPLIVVPATYQQAYDTVDKLAIVRDRGNWSFLQITPGEATPFKLILAKPISSSTDSYLLGKNLTFDAIGQMSSRLIRFGKYTSGMDSQMDYGFLAYRPDGPDLITKIPAQYNYCGDLVDGLARILIGGRLMDGKPIGGGLFGYIDESGQMAINPQFTFAEDFSNNRAYVEKTDNLGQIRRGYIDRNGDFQFEVDLGLAYNFFDNLAVFSIVDSVGNKQSLTSDKKPKFGYIDEGGNVVIPAQFQQAGNFQYQVACVLDGVSGKYGYISKSGQYQISPQFDQASDFFHLESIGQLELVSSSTNLSGFGFMSIDMGNLVPISEQYKSYFDQLDLNRDGQIGESEFGRSRDFLSIEAARTNQLVELFNLVLGRSESNEIEIKDFFNFYDQDQNQQINRVEYLSQFPMLEIAKSSRINRVAQGSGSIIFPSFPPLAVVKVDGEEFYINQLGTRIDQLIQSNSATNDSIEDP